MLTTNFKTQDVRPFYEEIVDEIKALKKAKINPVVGMKSFARMKALFEEMENLCAENGWNEKEFGKEVACKVIDNL